MVIILTILLISATDGKEASTEPSSGEETVTEGMNNEAIKKKRIDLGALLQQVLITTFKSFLQNLSKTLD